MLTEIGKILKVFDKIERNVKFMLNRTWQPLTRKCRNVKIRGRDKERGSTLGKHVLAKAKTIFPLDEFTNQGYEVTKQVLNEC